jgi:hypothetical protein
MRRVWVLLFVVGCGASLETRLRDMVANRVGPYGDRLFDCEASALRVERASAEEIWLGSGNRWWRPPAGATIDPETGEVIALPADLPAYYVIHCEPEVACYQGYVLVACDELDCFVAGDNGAEIGMVDCAYY